MLSLRRQVLFLVLLPLHVYGEAHINEEFQKNFQSLYNFMDELRNASGTLQNFFTKIQAVICPEQPICTSEGIQDRDQVLRNLPRYLDIGANSIRVESISDYIGICCLPCSCSDTCFAHGYCCLSKLLNRSVTEQERSDISNMLDSKREDETRSVDDKSDTSDIGGTTCLNRLSNEIPARSECVLPSAKSYEREYTQSIETGYFMITRCFDKTINKTLVDKCEAPSADEIDETVPVTSLRTGHIYWNQYCALCNKDGQETSRWRSIGDFGNKLVFFANTSDIPAFPSTPGELHQLALYQGDIIYSPPFPMADKRCILWFNECKAKAIVGEKNVRDIPWLLEACTQYTSPIQKKEFFTSNRYSISPFRNIFCFFCRENETGPLENSRCSLSLESSRRTSIQLTGLIDYRPNPKSSIDDQLIVGNGNCPCGEIYDKHLDYCRPVLCPPGDVMSGCQCVQLVNNLSGVPVLIYLKVIPKSGKLPTMTAKQIRSYNAALSKTLQNTVDGVTVEHMATFKQDTEAGENFLSLVLVRSNLDHDTKQTLKPFLDYLDSPSEMEMLTGKTEYSVRLTSRVRMWTEWDKLSYPKTYNDILIDLDTKEQDPPLVYSDWHSLSRVYTQSAYQVFSPLLYCRQVLLDGNEFFERDGILVLNITSTEISTPYYYRVAPTKARVCVKQFLHNHKSTGTKFGHTVSPILIMFGYVLLY